MAIDIWKTFPVKRNQRGVIEVDIWNGGSFSEFKRRIKRPYQLIRYTDAWIGRWDLISHEVYKDVSFWWAILAANGISNPFVEPKVGAVLRIPSINDILEWLHWR